MAKKLCFFGITNITQVDDPFGTLDFATDVCSTLRIADINCSVGIATRRACAKPAKDQSRQNFVVVEHVVNLSQRFMGNACKTSMQQND